MWSQSRNRFGSKAADFGLGTRNKDRKKRNAGTIAVSLIRKDPKLWPDPKKTFRIWIRAPNPK